MSALLELSDVWSGYAGVPAVLGVGLTVEPGEVVALLGPNGAGKTTTLLSTAGALRLLDGDIAFAGRSIRGLPPHRIAQQGLAFVPEGRGLLRQLTVKENLDLVRRRKRSGSLRDILALFPALDPLLQRRVALLSGGEQQMLALAKALLGRPRLLMVDELSLGLAPTLVEQLFPAVRRLAVEEGMAILLVEQHVHMALTFSDRVYVLSRGRVALEAPADELRGRPDLFTASYIGEGPRGGSTRDQ
jgi:branched-chain amino acid transport system ATP-binding protein